jgi:hypothetical protein
MNSDFRSPRPAIPTRRDMIPPHKPTLLEVLAARRAAPLPSITRPVRDQHQSAMLEGVAPRTPQFLWKRVTGDELVEVAVTGVPQDLLSEISPVMGLVLTERTLHL